MSKNSYQPHSNVQKTRRSLSVNSGILAVIIGGSIVSLMACSVKPTSYSKSNPGWGSMYGYSDKRINEDEFSVVVHGNPYTSKERVAWIALLRAAYITQEQGKSHFLIVKQMAEQMAAADTVTIPFSLGGPPISLLVGSYETMEPTAILLIRILPTQSQYPSSAIDAAEVIGALSEKLE